MPFQALETFKNTNRAIALCIAISSYCIASPVATAQDAAAKPPSNQREYDSAQADAVTKLFKTEGFLTSEMLTKFTSNIKEYRTIVSKGTNGRNAKELEILKAGLEYRVSSLSDLSVQEDPRLFENASKNLEREIDRAGSLLSNADDKKQFRQLIFEMAMPMLKQLLKSNFKARSVAMEIMLAMEVVPQRGSTRMQMFSGVEQVFIDILKDPNQPDAVKLRAANSAKRYLQKADAIPQIENALALAMIPELKRKFVGVGYQNALLMALEYVRAPRRLIGTRAPIVLQAAVETMSDTTQAIRTRCRAARLAGQQVGYDNNANFEPVAWKISEVALDAALLYSQAKNQKDVEWKYCGWYLYTAFHHEDKVGKNSNRGLLNRAPKSELVKDAFDATFGPAAYMMFREGKLVSAIGKLNSWVGNNRPANLVYSPNCPPIKVRNQAGGQTGG